MSRWPGRLITKTPVTPGGSAPNASAPGVWTLPEMAYWKKQGLWPDASADAYWSYVSYLLGTTSTNAAQNNTFLDSSTNNFTITRVGNTTQGSFTPYGTLWSNYFDGSGDYLSAPTNTAYDVSGGDYTIEAWINLSALPSANNSGNRVAGIGIYSSGFGGGWEVGVDLTQNTVSINQPGSSNATSASYTFAIGQWYHVAVCRASGTNRIFVNGTSLTLATNTFPNNATGSAQLRIGAGLFSAGYEHYFPGYISNFRLVKGTGLYSSNFTPLAAPLAAISGTSLLTCQSNRFIDNSTNNFTVTKNGDTRVAPFSPFVLAPPGYDTSVNGGSGYFDGSGDYITAPNNAAFNFGTGDFTAECWVYQTNNTAYQRILSYGQFAAGGNFQLEATSDTSITVHVNGGYVSTTVPSILNTWTHIAVVRTSGSVALYTNGVLRSTNSQAGSVSTANVFAVAGQSDGSNNFYGYVSNVRIVKGTAVYTAAFTPPTTPVTAIANTSLLLNFTNAGIFDASMNSGMETTGNTQVSTGQAKFGTTSAYFNGSGVLSIPANPAFNFGTGDFTIECWVYPTSNPAIVYFVSQAASNDYAPVVFFFSSGRPGIAVSPSNGTWTINTYAASAVSTNTWSHVAAVRYGNKWSVYINGVETVLAASTAVTPYVSTDPLGIGGEATGAPNYPYYGYIDDLRITKGVARYTANFTPPTAALPPY